MNAEPLTYISFFFIFLNHRRAACVCVPTSFCVTVSMMVPNAGMVDILTELEAAQKQSFTIYSQMYHIFLINVQKKNQNEPDIICECVSEIWLILNYLDWP